MLQRIACEQVRLGMYIEKFDGSWWKHPFWRSHFLLTAERDLEALRSADLGGVFIDISKGVAPDPLPLAESHPRVTPAASAKRAVPAEISPSEYRKSAATAERARATQVMNQSKKVMRRVFDGARLGKAVRSADVMGVVDAISASVRRNPAALIGVTRLKSKDEYTYLHSVAVCALMVNLARQLNLDPRSVQDMGVAGLLHDIGKMGVPSAVLNKPGRLTDEEFALIREHPDHGRRLLEEGEDVPDLAIDVCRHHHEKMDGTGYPFGLSGEQISLAARMGAICDVYDALTSNRAYKKASTPAEAITQMWEWDGHFDRQLLFRFMQSISVFPVGLLVRLRSNRLGIVLDNGARASRPRVLAFYGMREAAMIAPTEVVITDSLADDQIVAVEQPNSWGFDDWPMLRDQFLNQKRPSVKRG